VGDVFDDRRVVELGENVRLACEAAQAIVVVDTVQQLERDRSIGLAIERSKHRALSAPGGECLNDEPVGDHGAVAQVA
jgi:hypothetical protein